MFTVLKSFSGIARAIIVIIMEATEAAPGDSLNRGYTQAGAANQTKASSRPPRMAPQTTDRVFSALPTSSSLFCRPAPISRPMIIAAVEDRPKEATITIFSMLPAMV